MRPHTDVLTLGETMGLVTPTTPAPIAPSTSYVIKPGGAESNVASHLARLGHASAWAGRLGDEPIGRLIQDELEAAGVDMSLAEAVPGAQTGVYFKHVEAGRTQVLYYRRSSAASTMDPEFVDTLTGRTPQIVHLTGITAALSDSCHALSDAVLVDRRFGDATVSFDVNHRPQLWPDPQVAASVLLELARHADVVFVGLDEATTLWGVTTPDEVRALLPEPRSLVIKDGGNGATEFDGGTATFVPAPRIEIVEPVGAGDAFAAGWLAGLLRGSDAGERLRLGHAVAGAVMSTTFDDAELPAELRVAERSAAALG